MVVLVPATGSTGSFTQQPIIPNQFQHDPVLGRAARLFLPLPVVQSIYPDLSALADSVLRPAVFANIVNAERDLPYLSGSGFTAFGHPNNDSLVTSPGWRALQDMGIREGVVATGYDPTWDPTTARVVQFLKLHIWSASSAVVTCPSAMQDGAVRVLLTSLANSEQPEAHYSYPTRELYDLRTRVFKRAVFRLLSRDPREAWTSGQWMTERAGGSDVAGTETVATLVTQNGKDRVTTHATDIDRLPLGPWTVKGFKWFSSATDCGCVLLLAKTTSGSLSCFFAPTRRIVNGQEELNGIRIQRLKNKLGTRALPTAEVELHDMRAWLVGKEGHGIRTISTLLNITRFYNAVTSVGFLGRGLAIVRAFARVRTMPSLPPPANTLDSIPLFGHTLSTVTLEYRSDVLLTAFVSALLGSSESSTPSFTTPCTIVPVAEPNMTRSLLRILTPIAKARTAKHSISGLQECMEALGGVGYLENTENPEINIARLYRDANVLSIWEGTTDVLSTDTIKVLRGRDDMVMKLFGTWINRALSNNSHAAGMDEEKNIIRGLWMTLHRSLTEWSVEELLVNGRDVIQRLGDIVCAIILVTDAESDGNTLAIECARRFVQQRCENQRRAAAGFEHDQRTKWDQLIAFGYQKASSQAKL